MSFPQRRDAAGPHQAAQAHRHRFLTVHEDLRLVAGTIVAKLGTANLSYFQPNRRPGTACR